jgi:hypothetical protein
MEGTNQDDRYRVVDDIIYYKERIYLVHESMLKDKILRVGEGVHDLSTEQVRNDTPIRFTPTTTYSKEEMGEHFHGFHYMVTKSRGQGLYLCGGRQVSKYAHFFSIPSEYNASQVEDLFFREVFRLHGLSRNIVSDWDSRFLNAFW